MLFILWVFIIFVFPPQYIIIIIIKIYIIYITHAGSAFHSEQLNFKFRLFFIPIFLPCSTAVPKTYYTPLRRRKTIISAYKFFTIQTPQRGYIIYIIIIIIVHVHAVYSHSIQLSRLSRYAEQMIRWPNAEEW